jgi:hypothetical protein
MRHHRPIRVERAAKKELGFPPSPIYRSATPFTWQVAFGHFRRPSYLSTAHPISLVTNGLNGKLSA